jgi:hypothetical protein
MSQRPDKWVVLKITKDEETNYKVFATWFGGYLDGDRWKLNSGITNVNKMGDYLMFYGYSGSCYECAPPEYAYGTNSYTQGVLDNLIERAKEIDGVIEVMPKDTDWFELFEPKEGEV